jgi:hypothetical protein
VWNAEPLGARQGRSGRDAGLPPEVDSSPRSPIAPLQAMLNALGYNAGAEDGVFRPNTKSAVAAFQRDQGLPETGEPDAQTVSTLSARMNATGAAPTSPWQPSDHHPSTGCHSGHWVTEVLSGGEIVQLEDGSVWEIDDIGRIDTTLWLPTEDVFVCDDGHLMNADIGDTVGATRIR